MSTSGSIFNQNDLGSYNDLGVSYAGRLFEQARKRAMTGMLLRLLGLRRKMISLSARLDGRSVVRQHSAGLRTVELSSIRGSESRGKDFDGVFAPLGDHMRERWTGIARARLSDYPLPPIELIQVGDEYFVRDGHHRISVARELGAAFIEADVIVLEV